MTILDVKNVHKDYPIGKLLVRALNGVNLTIQTGEFLCVMGPSGSGKTTLLNLIGLLDEPSSGEIQLQGKSTSHLSYKEAAKIRSHFLGFIFQSFNLFPVLNSYENIEYPLLFHPLNKKERELRVWTALEELGIKEVAKHRPDELSGGQRQRVAIARALVTRPLLILADEPTANLDSQSANAVISAMQRLHKEHQTTFIFSTHDPRVMEHAHRIVNLKDGVIENGAIQEIVPDIAKKSLP